MKIIAEIPLPGPDVLVDVPRGGEVLTLKVQGGIPTIFVLVDKLALTEPRRFACYQSGGDLPDGISKANHVGTVTYTSGRPAVHVFEVSVIALSAS